LLTFKKSLGIVEPELQTERCSEYSSRPTKESQNPVTDIRWITHRPRKAVIREGKQEEFCEQIQIVISDGLAVCPAAVFQRN
jgi:hypothetical protein